MISNFINAFLSYGNKIFYSNGVEELSYGDLLREAMLLSRKLPTNKEPVVVYGHKEAKMLIAFFSCLINGNPYIPIDQFYPVDRIKTIIKESKAKFIINCSTNETFGLKSVYECTSRKEVCVSDSPEDLAYIIFTSGSTGVPKGVKISKKNLSNFIIWVNKVIPKKDDMVVYNQASFSFDLSVCDIYFTISNGYHLITCLDNDFERTIDIFNKNSINTLVITPTYAKGLLQSKRFNNYYLPNLSNIFFCGERLEKGVAKKLFNFFPKMNIINAYGPTEATCAVCSVNIKKRHLEYDTLPVGLVDDSAVEILVKDDEIILSGDSVSNGYLNIDSNNFDGIFYRTGDLGCIKDGYLFCYGRKDNQIKYKGYRIELEEIEEKLNEINDVYDAIVTCKKNEDNKVVAIIAYVVGKELQVSFLKETLEKKLPSYMIPKFIKIVDKIPTNISDKHDRKELLKNV